MPTVSSSFVAGPLYTLPSSEPNLRSLRRSSKISLEASIGWCAMIAYAVCTGVHTRRAWHQGVERAIRISFAHRPRDKRLEPVCSSARALQGDGGAVDAEHLLALQGAEMFSSKSDKEGAYTRNFLLLVHASRILPVEWGPPIAQNAAHSRLLTSRALSSGLL